VPSVVTANRLRDGVVVYLAPDGGWTEQIDHARVAETEDEVAALEAQGAEAVKRREVVAVYPMDVAVNGGTVDPLSVRERIRASHRTTLTEDWYDVPL
jgi:hypothetical protein